MENVHFIRKRSIIDDGLRRLLGVGGGAGSSSVDAATNLKTNLHENQQQARINQQDIAGSYSNELLFSNQTGLILHCSVGRELARAIEKADRAAAIGVAQSSAAGQADFLQSQPNLGTMAASSTHLNTGQQQLTQHHPAHQQSISGSDLNLNQATTSSIQIRWEKSNTGEPVEPILYSQQTSTSNQLPITASFLYNNPNTNQQQEHLYPVHQSGQLFDQQQHNNQQENRVLRQIRPSDGALIIEPFRPQDFRPDVHQENYRCIATSPSRGATLMSRDYRIRAQIPIFTTASNNNQQQGIVVGPEVMDELVIEGNDAQFRCQIPNNLQQQQQQVQLNGKFVQNQYQHQNNNHNHHHHQQQQSTSSGSEDLYQVLDWIEYPSETFYSVQSTTLNYASKIFPKKPGFSTSHNLDFSSLSMRYFVAPQSGDLHILNVDSSLNYRSFKCRVKNKLTGEIYASPNKAKLIVTESHSPVSPRLQLDQPQMRNIYLEGQLALVSCRGQAHPRPQVHWSRLVKSTTSTNDDQQQQRQAQTLSLALETGSVLQPIETSGHQTNPSVGVNGDFAQIGSLLLINNLQRNHSGYYVCQARNSAGEERLEMELLVRAPLKAKLTTSPANVLQLGKSLALDCTISGYPVEQIVFRHNQQVIKSISGSIPSTSTTHSNYKGQAGLLGTSNKNSNNNKHFNTITSSSNFFPTSTSGGANPNRNRVIGSNLTPEPTAGYFVVDEQQAQLTTALSSSSSSSSKLTDDDLLLDNDLDNDNQHQNSDSSGSFLPNNDPQGKFLNHVIVIVLEPQHTGAYQCFASNQFESVQSSAYIRVLDDPPRFKDTFRTQVYEQHQDISLQCSARANPLPEITWSLDDAHLPESARIRFGDFVTKDNLVISYVNISNAEVADTGLYKCTADNGLAQISHEAQINVSGPLQVKPTSNITVLASSTFRIRCPVAGYPILDIQWFHNDRRLPTNHRQRILENGTLEVEHMERSQNDQGLYSCLASSIPLNSGSGGASTVGAATVLQSMSSSSTAGGGASGGSGEINGNGVYNKQQAYGSVNVSIKAKPTIAPFVISNSLREGERATISCTVSSGDLPIEISWFRNGKPIWASSSSQSQQILTSSSSLLTSSPGHHRYHHHSNEPKPTSARYHHSAPISDQNERDDLDDDDEAPHQLNQLNDVRIIGVSEYSSTLLFESLSVNHSGNYTCLARNEAGSSSHQSQMIVQVSPKWSLEPSDSSVIRGGSMAIDCAASGYPLPRIIWTKASQSSGAANALDWPSKQNQIEQLQTSSNLKSSQQLGAWKSIVSSPHLQVFENGSLNLIDARDLDQGYYMCQASNGVGPGLSKVIKVTVNVAAQFIGAHHSIQFVVNGEQAQLKCQVRGDWPLTLHWFRGRNRLEQINLQEATGTSSSTGASGAQQNHAKISTQQLQQQQTQLGFQLGSTIASVLLVPGPSSPSSWSLGQLRSQARATNSISMIEQLAALIVNSEQVTTGSSGSTLSTAPSSTQPDNSIDTLAPNQNQGGLVLPRLSIHQTESLLSGQIDSLINQYSLIQQDTSIPTTSTTTNGHRTSLLANSHRLQTSPNLNNQPRPHVHAQLTSVLTISQADRSDSNAYKCLAANHFGFDERTIQLIVQDKPDRIEEISLNESHSRTIIIGWMAPHDGNSPILNYLIQYKMAGPLSLVSLGGDGGQIFNSVIDQSSALSSPLLTSGEWLNYSLPVGSSQASYYNLSTTPGDNGQQQQVSLINNNNNNNNQASMNFASGTGNGGPKSGSRALFKVSINALRPLTRYLFRVGAENKLGLGPLSRIFEANTLDEAPSAAPSKVKAVAQSSSSILVSWSRLPEIPSKTNPTNSDQFYGLIQGYYVAYKLAGGDESPQTGINQTGNSQQKDSSGNAGSLPFFKTVQQDDKLPKYDALITGLKKSSKYLISVQAFNTRGTGPSSEPILVKTLEMDPPRQVKLRIRQATNCSLELDWRPLSQAAIDDATKNLISDPTTEKQPASQPGATTTGSGQQQQQQFDANQLQLSESGRSQHLNNRINNPTDQFSDEQPQSAMIGDQVDYYSLFQAELKERPRWTEIQVPGTSSSFHLDNLKCGTRYQFYMLGINRIGRGEQSDILDTKTIGGTPLLPDRQSCFDVINSTCFIIRLDAWQDNGCPIQQYSVQYRRESTSVSLSSTQTSDAIPISGNTRTDWINLAQVTLNKDTNQRNADKNTITNQDHSQSDATSSSAELTSSSNSAATDSNTGKVVIRRKRRWTTLTNGDDSTRFNSGDENNLDMSSSSSGEIIDDAAYMFDYPGSPLLVDAATSATGSADSNSNLLLADGALDYAGDIVPSSVANNRTKKRQSSTSYVELSPQHSDEPFNFLSESMLPAFEEPNSEFTHNLQQQGSTSSLVNDDSTLMRFNSATMWSDVPETNPTRQQPKSRSSIINQQQSNNLIRTRSTGNQVSQNVEQVQQQADSRKIRLCNLVPNSLYTIQMTAINSVGPTEAQLNLWTSMEGIEYDAIGKRYVVSRYGPGGSRMMSSKSSGNRGGYDSSIGGPFDSFNGQWPVLMPILLAIVLVSTCLVLLIRRVHNNNSNNYQHNSGNNNCNGPARVGGNNDQSNQYRSNASSTTTTSSATNNTNMSNESGQEHCQNFLHPLNNHHQPLLNHHHQSNFDQAPSSSISEAAATIGPSAFAPSELGDCASSSILNNQQQLANDTYALVSQRIGLASLLDQQQQHNSPLRNNVNGEEPGYGIVSYAESHPPSNYAQTRLSMQNQYSLLNNGSNSATLGHHHHNQHPQAIIISNNLQDSMTLPHNHANAGSRPRNVFLCRANGSNTLKAGDLHSSSAAQQFYGLLNQVAAQQQRVSLYATGNQDQTRATSFLGPSHQIASDLTDLQVNSKLNGLKNYAQLPDGGGSVQLGQNGLVDATTSPIANVNNNDFIAQQQEQADFGNLNQSCLLQTKEQLQQQYDNCFMSIVDEVARATDTLRGNANQNQNIIQQSQCLNDQSQQQASNKFQLVDRRCNQPDCFSMDQL